MVLVQLCVHVNFVYNDLYERNREANKRIEQSLINSSESKIGIASPECLKKETKNPRQNPPNKLIWLTEKHTRKQRQMMYSVLLVLLVDSFSLSFQALAFWWLR